MQLYCVVFFVTTRKYKLPTITGIVTPTPQRIIIKAFHVGKLDHLENDLTKKLNNKTDIDVITEPIRSIFRTNIPRDMLMQQC